MTQEPLVYDGWLKVARRSVNGRTYDILLSPSAVAAWVTNGHGEILLVRQFRPAVLQETWEIPAGVLDKEGLGPKNVLREELIEETGLNISEDQMEEILSYVPQIGYNDSRLTIYRVRLMGSPELPPLHDDDVLEARWFTPEEVEGLIAKGTVMDEKTILAYYRHLGLASR